MCLSLGIAPLLSVPGHKELIGLSYLIPLLNMLYYKGVRHLFIFTAKFSRKKAILMVVALAVILCAIVFFVGRQGKADAIETTSGENIRSEEDVVEYLNSLGWEVGAEPIEVQKIVIPGEFSEVYENYNILQKEQGFDLSEYSGIDAVRYTYEVLNYPGEESGIVADVIVADDCVIGGDIQSLQLDGFMQGLTENTQ